MDRLKPASTPARRGQAPLAMSGMRRVAASASRATILALLCLFAWATADAGHPVSMWQVNGAKNRVFLLGSIHLLRAGDHPLPSVMEAAYDEAETLFMEMDMDDVDPMEAQQVITELGLIRDGTSLPELMGPAAWSEAEDLATRVDIPLFMLEGSEPWLAAIMVEQLMLTRIGFDPAYGIESRMVERAGVDGKEIIGLETVRQQLGYLDNMSLESQRALLLQSLEESADIEKIMDELVAAWREGDIGFLETNMLNEIRQHQELYKTLVIDRNRNWVERCEELLKETDDYLVIVGTLHLIGEDGVPALLAERGFEVEQMQQE